jgi:hypothetical protein
MQVCQNRVGSGTVHIGRFSRVEQEGDGDHVTLFEVPSVRGALMMATSSALPDITGDPSFSRIYLHNMAAYRLISCLGLNTVLVSQTVIGTDGS